MSKKGGRPSTFTEAAAKEICARLSEGEPLRQICRDAHMPAWQTVYDWMRADEELSRRIAHARELGHDAIAEECVEIANTPQVGVIETIKADGTIERRTEDMLGHRKLQIETRLKLLAKWNPKKYGEKIQQEHSGTLTLGQLIEAATGKKNDESSSD